MSKKKKFDFIFVSNISFQFIANSGYIYVYIFTTQNHNAPLYPPKYLHNCLKKCLCKYFGGLKRCIMVLCKL